MNRTRTLTAGLAVVGIALVATSCGIQDNTATSSSSVVTTSSTTSTTVRKMSLADFAAAADAVCVRTSVKVNALQDPDGVGGNKQLGLGRVVRVWADELAAITAPPAVAKDWVKATELLRRSGTRLDDAERLAGAGDAAGSGAAQSEALWSMQPAVAEIIGRLGAPFKACFVE
jgi:hypothetical protein